MVKKQVIIIGGGPAGMMAADVLSDLCHVSIYEQGKSIGHKFLVAGKGGLNITNNATGAELKSKYSPKGFMDKALEKFDTSALRKWLEALDIPTFVGSSGRVFPVKGIKAIDVLNKIKAKLISQGVQIFTQHEFIEFNSERSITFKNAQETFKLEADYIIFALGGASWPVTGSDGRWRNVFEKMGVETNIFQSSNCGVNVDWPLSIQQNHAGKPLKNIAIRVAENITTGEALITDYGLEGNAIYPLVPFIRNELNPSDQSCISIDLKPTLSERQLLEKVSSKTINTKDYSSVFNITSAQLAIIKAFTSKENFFSVATFVHSLKNLRIPVKSLRPVDEAISTVGGIEISELNEDFSLRKYPWIYTIGEMVDWDAPTGGFLLQGCFAMGNLAARSILD